MSAAVWPPIAPDKLKEEEDDTLKAELKWLLDLLQESLGALKSGLQECVALLAPDEPGTTLAISSVRSESVKGFVTRVGTRIEKGDIRLTLASLPPPAASPPTPFYPLRLNSNTSLALPQLSQLSTLLNNSLDIIDISAWTGDPQNAPFIAGQLKLLSDTIAEASAVLKGSPTTHHNDDSNNSKNNSSKPKPTSTSTTTSTSSWDGDDPSHLLDPNSFTPPLPATLFPHLTIQDGALILTIRTLTFLPPSSSNDPSSSPSTSTSTSNNTSTSTSIPTPTTASSTTSAFSALTFNFTSSPSTPTSTSSSSSYSTTSLRARLGLTPRLLPHDEEGMIFSYLDPYRSRGQGQGQGRDRGVQQQEKQEQIQARVRVRVREKVRVESQDPALLAVAAKLGALGREVRAWRGRVGVVRGEGEGDDEDEDEGEGEDEEGKGEEG